VKVVGVCSVKGGTGKTLCSINLAYYLQKISNKPVGLIDSDIDSSNFGEFVSNAPPVEVTEDKKFKLSEWNGIKVWSMSLLTEKWRPISLTGDRYAAILNDVVHYSNWDDVEYLVVDLPAGAMDTFRGMVYIFAEELVGDVIVIQPAFEDNARRAIKLHEVNDIPIVGLIENMSYFICPYHKQPKEFHIFGDSIGEKLAEEFGIDFFGKIPLLPDLQERIKKGNPVLEDYGEVFERAAKKVIETPMEKVGIVKKLKRKLVKVTRDTVIKILAYMFRKINEEMEIPHYERYQEGRTLKLYILNDTRTKALANWTLRLKGDKLVFVKNPKKVDFRVDTTFRTLARILLGKRKTRDGRVIPYDVLDAWLNQDLEIYGQWATQRAFDLVKNVFFDENVRRAVSEKFKFLEKYI